MWYQLASQTVTLEMEAKGLPKMDRFGSADPYVILSAGAARTTVIKNTQAPKWPLVTARVGDLGPLVRFDVYDHDWGALRDDYIGSAEIPLESLLRGPCSAALIDAKLAASEPDYTSSGTLTVARCSLSLGDHRPSPDMADYFTELAEDPSVSLMLREAEEAVLRLARSTQSPVPLHPQNHTPQQQPQQQQRKGPTAGAGGGRGAAGGNDHLATGSLGEQLRLEALVEATNMATADAALAVLARGASAVSQWQVVRDPGELGPGVVPYARAIALVCAAVLARSAQLKLLLFAAADRELSGATGAWDYVLLKARVTGVGTSLGVAARAARAHATEREALDRAQASLARLLSPGWAPLPREDSLEMEGRGFLVPWDFALQYESWPFFTVSKAPITIKDVAVVTIEDWVQDSERLISAVAVPREGVESKFARVACFAPEVAQSVVRHELFKSPPAGITARRVGPDGTTVMHVGDLGALEAEGLTLLEGTPGPERLEEMALRRVGCATAVEFAELYPGYRGPTDVIATLQTSLFLTAELPCGARPDGRMGQHLAAALHHYVDHLGIPRTDEQLVSPPMVEFLVSRVRTAHEALCRFNFSTAFADPFLQTDAFRENLAFFQEGILVMIIIIFL